MLTRRMFLFRAGTVLPAAKMLQAVVAEPRAKPFVAMLNGQRICESEGVRWTLRMERVMRKSSFGQMVWLDWGKADWDCDLWIPKSYWWCNDSLVDDSSARLVKGEHGFVNVFLSSGSDATVYSGEALPTSLDVYDDEIHLCMAGTGPLNMGAPRRQDALLENGDEL